MSKHLKADLAILSITVVWGSSFIIMKNIVDVMGVWAYLAMRFSVAAALMVLLFLPKVRAAKAPAVAKGGIVGLVLFAGMALQVAGLRFTSASNSAFITGLNVVLVPVLSAFLLRKQPPFKAIAGVACATVGLFLLTGGFDRAWNPGDTLTLLCACCFALQIILIDKFNQRTDPVQIAVFQIVGAALLYLISWRLFDPRPVAFTLRNVLTVLYTGAFGTAFAFGVQTIAQKHTSPTRTALIISCEPVFGAIFAMIVPDNAGKVEALTLSMAAGCLLIFGGMLISELKFGSARAKDEPDEEDAPAPAASASDS